MSALNLQLTLPDGRRVAVTLPDGETPRRLVPALVGKLEIPTVDEDGAALAYYLADAAGERLPDDTPLAEIPLAADTPLTLAGVSLPAVDGRRGNHDVYAGEPAPVVAPPAPDVPRREPLFETPPRRRRRRRFRLTPLLFLLFVIFLCRAIDTGIDRLNSWLNPPPATQPAAVDVSATPARPPADLVAFGEALFFVAQAPDGWHLYRATPDGAAEEDVARLGPAGAPGSSAGLQVVDGRLFYATFDEGGQPRTLFTLAAPFAEPVLLLDAQPDVLAICPLQLAQTLFVAQVVAPDTLTLSNVAGGSETTFAEPAVEPNWCRQQQVVGGALFFPALSDDGGRELWRYTAGEEAARLVADLLPGPLSSAPANLQNVGEELLFEARTAEQTGLWRLAAGGEMPEQLYQGGIDLRLADEERLYFAARSAGAVQLNVYDAAQDNLTTVPFPSADAQRIVDLFIFNARLHVATLDGGENATLWQLSADGTRLIPTTALDGVPFSAVGQFTVVGERYYFVGQQGTAPGGIWYGGVGQPSSVPLETLPPAGDDNPVFLTAVGGVLFYVAEDGQGGRAVYRTDGTTAGTWLLGG